MAEEKKRADAKSLLAEDLKHGYETGFLSFGNIVVQTKGSAVAGLKSSFIAGLRFLIGLHGFTKIIGPFYVRWRGKREDNLALFEQALLNFQPFVETLFGHVSHDEVAAALEELVAPEDSLRRVVTWDNLAHAFPYRDLAACVRESRKRADEAADDAPEAEVMEAEDLIDEEVTAEPPADGEPTDK